MQNKDTKAENWMVRAEICDVGACKGIGVRSSEACGRKRPLPYYNELCSFSGAKGPCYVRKTELVRKADRGR